MGWIKSKDGKRLVNVVNVRSVGIEYVSASNENYYIFADVSNEQAYWLIGPMAKEDAEDLMARIERWLEKGAPGVFQV